MTRLDSIEDAILVFLKYINNQLTLEDICYDKELISQLKTKRNS